MSGLRPPGLIQRIKNSIFSSSIEQYEVNDSDSFNVNGEYNAAPLEPESERTLPEGVSVQNTKLNRAEAKRYRKKQKAIRDSRRTAAGMVC